MSSKKKLGREVPPLVVVKWYNMDYKLLSGVVLPEHAWNALVQLAPIFGCRDLGHAVRFAIEQFIEQNAGILVTKDRDWIRKLGELRGQVDLNGTKPDGAGIENVQHFTACTTR
ncbi:MAG: hypothetical protein ABSC50_13100 [Candidatus Bathyarchaeia archaeon]|jgi:hypothetical protein